MIGRLIFLLTLVNAVPILSATQGLEIAKGTKVFVLVGKASELEEELGLSEDYIQSQVEIRLRNNGVVVSEFTTDPTAVFYFVQVTSLKVIVGDVVKGYAMTHKVQFYRNVSYVVKGLKYTRSAILTEETGIRLVSKETAKDLVMEGILDDLDIISNDMLKNIK